MSGKRIAGYGLAAIVAYFGRTAIFAFYGRGVQALTDLHIMFVGSAFLSMLTMLSLNAFFVVMGWHEAQMVLTVLFAVVSVYFLLIPAISVPLGAVLGLKKYVGMVGMFVFWMEWYLVVTMLVPFGQNLFIFGLCQILVFLILASLLTGHVPVDNAKLYTWGFRISVGSLIAVIVVFVLRGSELKVDAARLMSNKATAAMSEKDVQSVQAADSSLAEWITRNVKIGPRGDQVVIVKDRVTGELKAVPAQPYLDQEKKRRSDVIASVTGKAASGNAPRTHGVATDKKPTWGDSTSWLIWLKDNSPWGYAIANLIIVGHVYIFTGMMILALFLGWNWWKKKDDDKTDVASKTVVATSSSDVSVSTVVIAVLLGVAAYFWYQYENNPDKVRAPILPLPTITTGSPSGERDSSNWKVQFTDLTRDFPQQPHSGTFAARLGAGSHATERVEMVVEFPGGNHNLKLMGGSCVPGRGHVPRKCEGNFDAGFGRAGVFSADWSPKGDNLRVKLYDTPHLRDITKHSHHAELLIVLESK